MFKRPENIRSEAPEIRSEIAVENQLGNIGNQANIDNNILNISNEANNDLLNEGMRENGPLENGGRISKEDNLQLLKNMDRIQDEDKNGLIEDLDQIRNEDGIYSLDKLDGLHEDDYDAASELNESMIAKRPKKKKEKEAAEEKEKAKKAQEKKRNKDLEPGVEDLNVMSEDNKPIAGWNFDAHALPERHRPSGGNKFISKLAWYSGKTVGKVLGWLVNILWLPGFIKNMGTRTINWFKNRSGLQERRDHGVIPGWNGARFEERSGNRDELNIDFRKVPEVWAYPIPGKAEESKGVPRDPIFSVYVSQPEEDQDKQMDAANNTGYSGVGIEFSRYSQTTQRWERFNLRYGFYTQGGLPETVDAITAFHKATIPAQLMNERRNPYDVSRSYPVKNRQVNAVLKASRTYADKGYNNYTRNCTTFAKDMAKAADVPGVDALFKRDDVEFSSKARKQLFGASIITTYSKADFSDYMTKVTHGDNYNYQGFGNKRATAKDYEHYKDSLSYFKAVPTEADMPNAAAENLRRDRRWKTGGTLGKWKNKGKQLDEVKEMIQDNGNQILNILQNITPDGRLDGDLPDELSGIIDMLHHMDRPLQIVGFKLYTRSEMEQMRTGLTDMIQKLNLLLLKYYKNDKRLHFAVLNTINLLNDAIDDVDGRYQQTFGQPEYEIGGGDLGTLRKDMQHSTQTFKLHEGEHDLDITPSEFEGWL